MQAGIARNTGRTFVAIFTVVSMVLSLMFLFANQADADHIPVTGQVPDNCVKFDHPDTGTKSPSTYPGVSIELVSWDNTPQDPHEATFSISGLAAGQAVDISVKAGQLDEERDGFGNGTHTILWEPQNGISHITFCVVDNRTGKLVIEKEVLEGDTTVVFTFTTNFSDDFSLSHGEDTEFDLPVNRTYSVSEDVPDGWELVDATCDNGSPINAIELIPNGTVTCTFQNRELPDETTTTTTVQETTTTTAEVIDTTVTTQPETTTTEPEDEVLGTTVTTQPEETTTTIEDEVLAEELPFTGVDRGALAIIAAVLASLGLLVTLSARRLEE